MRTPIAMAVLALLSHLATATAAAAGAHAPMGETIEASELASAAGGKVAIAGAAAANAIVFFRPDQKSHASTLAALAACEKELAGKDVRWVAVVPGRFALAEAREAAAAAGLQMPVALDEGDAVYNRLGIAVHPTVAVLDAQHRLVQLQPYTKLNFCELVLARIRRVLGEVSEAELQKLIDPSAGAPRGDASRARTELRMASMLLAAGNKDKALELARKGASADPTSAAAQLLIGQILAAKGDCAGASAAFAAALRLEPNEPRAAAGRKACAGSR